MNKIVESLNEAINNIDSFVITEDEEEEVKPAPKQSKYPFELSLATSLYDEAGMEVEEIPTFEDTNEWIYNCSRSEYRKAYNAVKKAIENVGGNIYNGNIELSDNATLNDVDDLPENANYDNAMLVYGNIVDQAFEEFERITGVEAWQDGRMGRHIVVSNDFENAYNYDKLCAEQSAQEDWVIETFNEEMRGLYGEESE